MYGERYPLAMMAVFFVLRRPEPNQIEASKFPRAYGVLFPRLFIFAECGMGRVGTTAAVGGLTNAD